MELARQGQSTSAVDLSAVVVNWNTAELLARCLTSLWVDPRIAVWQQDGLICEDGRWTQGERPLSVDILVVDNASSDGSAEMVRQCFPWARLVENWENVGFARANNQAIRQSQGPFVVLLNSDTEVRRGALGTLIAFMEAHPSAGAVGARLLNPDGSLQPSCHPMLTPGREFWRLLFLERIWPWATYPMHRWDVRTPRQVEVIKGACLLLRREALEQVGLLDERYFMYTEEVDLCYRLAQAGWELWWVPQAEVVHHNGQSARQMAEAMYVQLYRSKVEFYRKYGGEPRADRFKRLVRLAYWPRLALSVPGRIFSPSVAARTGAYRRLLAELQGM